MLLSFAGVLLTLGMFIFSMLVGGKAMRLRRVLVMLGGPVVLIFCHDLPAADGLVATLQCISKAKVAAC